MDFPDVTRLYKYYSYNHYSLSVLANKTVWFAKPQSFNDPFDLDIDFADRACKDDFLFMIERLKTRSGLTKEEPEDLHKKEMAIRAAPESSTFSKCWGVANRKFSEDRKGWGVFCLSECNDSILMWSHYADCHKGFCIEFVRSPDNHLGDIEMAHPVHYTADYPMPSPFSEKGMAELPYVVLMTKAEGWKYEREWRLISDEGDVELPPPGEISGIIFGLRMLEPQREEIRRTLCNSSGIVYREAKRVSGRFALEIRDI